MDLIAKSLMGSYAKGPIDPYFEYTTLLLRGNGLNGAQNGRSGPAAAYRDGTFLDGSTNNFTITRNGNTTQGTFSPFSQTGWGNYFDGTGDYLSIARNTALIPGANVDFTIEAWIYPLRVNSPSQMILGFAESGTNSDYIWSITTTGGLTIFNNYFLGQGSYPTSASGLVVANQWNHVMISRTGSTLSIGANGSATTFSYSLSLGQNGGGSYQFTIGADQNGDEDNFTGYISNLRIITGAGTGLYNGTSYIVPTTPLTAITGTQLLTCQSNRFIDNSTNNFTITRNGDTRVVAFSPFNPTASWSAATYGGSGYFDGTGDYLSVPANASWNLGSGAFCIECWSYPTATQSDRHLFSLNNSGGTGYWVLRYNTGTVPQFIYNNYATSLTSSTAAVINAWNHIAMVSNGTTMSLYLNGTRVATSSATSINDGSANSLIIGSQLNVSLREISGYLTDGRVVKGSAVYDPTQTTITVPTAPLTAITNTSLLLNFTNAGIYDATSKNDLETVGNAQISTAQSRWGGSSMSFDGTGDWLQTPVQQNFVFGTGDFTVEFWIYANALSGYQNIFDGRAVDATLFPVLWLNNTALEFYANGSVRVSSAITTNTWYHVALSRSGTSTKLFINGTQVGSTYTDSNNYVAGSILYLSRYAPSAQNYLNGYLQDLRITRGYARYTANFTAPTAAFPTL